MKKLLALLLLSPLAFTQVEYGRSIDLSCEIASKSFCDGKGNIDSCYELTIADGLPEVTKGILLRKKLGIANIKYEDKNYMPVPEWKDTWELTLDGIDIGSHDLKGNAFIWTNKATHNGKDLQVDANFCMSSGIFEVKITHEEAAPANVIEIYKCKSVKSLLD